MHDGANKLADCTVLTGANLDHLPAFADHTFDSCVTDPPYELGFMGKAWDKSGIAYSVELWREVYRVLKPGAYLLAFGGSRTYHRMACAIEDAGFEIRDQIQWIYGSGFPKSLDVSKAIDKELGCEKERLITHYKTQGTKSMFDGGKPRPASLPASLWDGFGTALKPAHEPIVMARKPLEKGLTVAQNVLKWGTGAINVDGCRVETFDGYQENAVTQGINTAQTSYAPASVRRTFEPQANGRFPANVIHDGSDEVLAGFPHTASNSGTPFSRKGIQQNCYGKYGAMDSDGFYGDEGSAARFFYTAKASKYDREAGLPEAARPTMGNGIGGQPNQQIENNRNHHPTVKPTDLMQYLCRMVTPPGGLILEPFLGSGSTAKAALIERFRVVGIELNPEYAAIADARCKQLQVKLF